MFKKNTIENFFIKNKNYIIFFLWIISSVLFYFYVNEKYGNPPRYGMFDWNRYKDGAIDLLNLKIPNWPSYYFFSYCLYLALSIKIFFPYLTLVIAIFLNLISSFLVFNISTKLFNNTTAFISLLIFLFYPYYQMWVFFIQPVTFFSFCLLFVLYSVVNFENNRKKIIILFVSLILAFTARPNGVTEVISVYIFLFIFYLSINKTKAFSIIILGIPIIYLLLIFLNNSMSIQNVYDAWYITEMQEFGFKNNLEYKNNNFKVCLGMTPTEILNLEHENAPDSNLSFWICSLFSSPLDVIKIFFVRFLITISFYKPILSLKHNVFSLITLIPIYIFFFIGLLYNLKLKKIFIFLSLILALSTVAIHTVDGDNRVYTAFLPFVFILASGGIYIVMKKIKILK